MIIDTSDSRTVKAIVIAAGAAQWLKCTTKDGRKAYGIPSQTKRGLVHLVDRQQCSCVDFQRRRQPCKHVLAVEIYCALVAGFQKPARRAPVRG
jgi:hypothetical protein